MRRPKKLRSYDGTRIAYRIWGKPTDATALICFSGIACDEVYWVPLARDLSQERLVITWDYPYHGDSSKAGDPDEITISALARHADEVRKAASVEQAALTGHSMGVQVMLDYYRLFGERVAGMISIAGPYQHTVGHLYGTNVGHGILTLLLTTATVQPAMAQILWRLAVTPQFADPLGRVGGLIGRAPAEVMSRYFNHLATIDLVPLLKMFKAGQEHSAADMLEKIDVPVLILHGTHDVMTPLALAEEMGRKIPAAELVAVEGGAHTLPAEDPVLIASEMRRFLGKRVDK